MTLHIEMPTQPLTLGDWEAIDEVESGRRELVDGVLIVAPQPTPFHNRAVFRLANLLERVLPDSQIAVAEIEVLLAEDPPTVRVPDLAVVPRSRFSTNPRRFDAADVVLAIEVVSPSTRRTDYVAKRFDYAQAGIRAYWIVDLDSAQVICLELVGNDYVEAPVQRGDDALTISSPYAISFNWPELTC